MRLYFKPAELLLRQTDDDAHVIEMEGKVIARFTRANQALREYNRIRKELEVKLPPTEATPAERRALLERYLADQLVTHNSLRAEPQRKPPKSRTFG